MIDIYHQFQHNFSERVNDVPRIRSVIDFLSNGDWEEMPPILLYGPADLPHRLIWQEALRRCFQLAHIPKHIETTVEEGKKGAGIVYYHHDGYLLFDLMHPETNKNLIGLLDFMKSFLSQSSIHGRKRIVVLENMDQFHYCKMSYMLKAILEKYASTTWFICTTHATAIFDRTFQSRMILLKVPKLNTKELETLLDTSLETNQSGFVQQLFYRDQDPPKWTDGFIEICKRRVNNKMPEIIQKVSQKMAQRLLPLSLIVKELLPHLLTDLQRYKFTRIACVVDEERARVRNSLEPFCYEKLLWSFYEIWKT